MVITKLSYRWMAVKSVDKYVEVGWFGTFLQEI